MSKRPSFSVFIYSFKEISDTALPKSAIISPPSMTSFSGGFKIFYYKIELSLLLTIKEPSMFINPAEINTMFEALMTFLDTYSGKTGIPYSSTTDLTF